MEPFEALPAFRQFLAAAIRLRPSSIDYRERLSAFLVQAKPLIIGPTRQQWQALKPDLDVLSRWYTNCDLLDRIVGLEDSYTELIAWALRPATHPESAQLRQRSWLASLGIDLANELPAEPRTQVLTPDGIPDLVLSFGTQTVVVEVKTDSPEHPAPSGTAQTLAYPDAVRSILQLNTTLPLHMVFLTPDSRAAENPDAICTNFAHFAVVLARALADMELPVDVRVLVGMVITLLATFESPIKNMVGWQRDIDDTLLIDHIGDIFLTTRLLSGARHV
jgi:hypothetical protein